MSHLFTLSITFLDLSFIIIKGPMMGISSEVINYSKLKLTSGEGRGDS